MIALGTCLECSRTRSGKGRTPTRCKPHVALCLDHFYWHNQVAIERGARRLFEPPVADQPDTMRFNTRDWMFWRGSWRLCN